ncbi:NAD(P)H-dependent oxidoreductase [Xylocopilactobacillus apicola]|uniref:NAD(P)H-dependent oxidoreductase n=1 Tax=Xylocopilactobacillus apicola TaxID=2932184 RepID=A0AAU9DMP0_9LACO|nr:NAD(P)H-dependent oxidoreductase [Xylocopilactobacillus apicola]BDR58257.1 NAD(P)H-dependent oxidoreductase [Xylocopilactobacillus apicola]
MENKGELRKEIIAVFNRRYATKKFDPTKKIDPADWQVILEAARLSPSSFGYEPWKFLLIENEQIKEDLKDFAWGAVNSINGASHLLLCLARTDVTADSDYVKHLVEDVFQNKYDPHSPRTDAFRNFQKHDFQLNDPQTLFDWACKQTYIALGNMLTTAAWLGIDSCPIEGFNREKLTDYLVSHDLMDPKHFGVSYLAGFGYRDQEITPKKRQPLTDIYQVI